VHLVGIYYAATWMFRVYPEDGGSAFL